MLSGSRKPSGRPKADESYASSASTSSTSASPKVSKSKSGPLQPRWEDKLVDEAFRKMTLAELKSATNNFDKRNLLGSGGFGDVYRGHGPQGQEYAVKRARPGVVVRSGSSQGVKDFEREVVTMSQLSHKHLVKLLGYCTDRGELIVVYELMQGGSLAGALHGTRKGTVSKDSGGDLLSGTASTPCTSMSERESHSQRSRVGFFGAKLKNITMAHVRNTKSDAAGRSSSRLPDSWGARQGLNLEDGASLQPPPSPLSLLQRVDIATATAEALYYLHSALKAPVVHRDIKPDNILLDSKMRAKVGDFGLVKLIRGCGDSEGGRGGVAESTRVTGTRGYLDPDYWSEGRASPAVDVFSFGVVMLELLTGRKPLVSRATDLDAMVPRGSSSSAEAVNLSENLPGLETSSRMFSCASMDREPAQGAQVPLREWVDMVLLSKKSLHAVVDPKMDLDLGTSARALKTLEEPGSKGVNSAWEEAYKKRKDEAVEKGLKAFLQLALKCTAKTARRPPMAEVATQLEQIRRELRAARENQ